MGISGLLPFVKNATRQTNIKEFRGCTVAIDSYCWLHKGAFSCAEKLALGEKTDQYVYYCLKYVNTLLSYDIKPVMVFDGCRLPSKKEVERQRREKREHYKKKAAQLLRDGKKSEARDALRLCIDITSEMALQLMNACREKGVDCIVAPYEADAQLAYLNKVGIAQVVVSEDSDLVLFGCEKIMYKMDFNGNGLLVEKDSLNKTVDLRADLYSFEKFRYMCILSGCDYLTNLKGIGLKKAMMVLQRTRQPDMATVIKKIPTTLNLSVTVTPDYIDGFFRADNTFLYQLVFDPMKRKQIPLNPYAEGITKGDVQYAGPYMNEDVAYQLALGNLSVYNMSKISHFDPDTFRPKSKKWAKDSRLCMLSIWDRNYRPMSRMAASQLANKTTEVERKSTKGQEVKVNLNLPEVTKKRSPIKRTREPEGENNSLSNVQLAALYGSGTSATDLNESPAKRRKSEIADSDRQVLNDLSDLLCDTEVTTNFAKESQVHEESGVQNENSVEVTTGNTSFEETENKSKKFNVFRASSGKIKDNFKLNAAKTEVVSRFFTTSEQKFKKSTFFNKLNDSFEKQSDTSMEENEVKNIPPCVKTESDNIQEEDKGIIENPVTTKKPYGSFGFKSKLDSFKSSFGKSDTGIQNENLSKQFKPVGSNIKITKQVSSSSCTNTSAQSFSQSSSTYSSQSLRNCSLSQGGDLYSIDGDSFVLSEPNSEPQINSNNDVDVENVHYDCSALDKKKNISKSEPLFYLGEALESTQENVKRETVCDLTSNDSDADIFKNQTSVTGCKGLGLSKSATSTPQSSNRKKSLTGCRNSGLSKKSKSNVKSNENSQASIKNFFSSFNYDKGKKEKLGHTRMPLSPKKNNVV